MTSPNPNARPRIAPDVRRAQYIEIARRLEEQQPTPPDHKLPAWTMTDIAKAAGVCREAVRRVIKTRELLEAVRNG
jgi:hypothetical protein